MMKIIFACILVLSMAWGPGIPRCFNNTQPADIVLIKMYETETKKMLAKKENKLINEAIKDYKEALEEKKKTMMKLWKTTTEVEFLMKENQMIRKRMIKHWESVKNTH